jgi:adenosylcobyric acid synthase
VNGRPREAPNGPPHDLLGQHRSLGRSRAHIGDGTLAPTLMIQGTASGVGKSALVAGLCRLFRRTGLRVAPFKAQNMSNNAAVCSGGGEIGRAQASQAEAAGVAPSVDMNPILLKPEGDSCSQVVVGGRVWRRLSAREYHAAKPDLLPIVADSLSRLRASYDLVVIEGAGSPAEVNLRAADLVNMTVAHLADAPVLLVADIDRGGAFASLVGTLELLDSADRARVRGLLINRFRGDLALLQPGLDVLEARTGCPVLGVVPYLRALHLPAEDSQDLDRRAPDWDRSAPVAHPRPEAVRAPQPADERVDIAVISLPRIANFDDFTPLEAEPGVRLRYPRDTSELGVPDLVVVPGSKSTLADLAWLRASGFGTALLRLAAAGTPILGICGGYQMLGQHLTDSAGADGEPASAQGLGLLDVSTTFTADKTTRHVHGTVLASGGFFGCLKAESFAGYEIHLGRTSGQTMPFASVSTAPAEPSGLEQCSGPDGALSRDGLVAGTYVHSLFHAHRLRHRLLTALAGRRGIAPGRACHPIADPYDRLADAIAASVDLPRVYTLCSLPEREGA